MNTLFPAGPEGFSYYPDFIGPEEEDQLLELLGSTEFRTFIFQGYEAKRRVASFGYDWNFDKRTLTEGVPIPDEFHPLMDRVAAKLSLKREDFAELLLTEYPAGAVINWHRDAPPFDLIAGVSLMSDCRFRFRPHDPARQGRGFIMTMPVQRRSLYVIGGEARTDWQHSIPASKSMRYSITLRTLKQ
jgi:alkylated DNA repair dioxygenase AlkB